MSTPKYAESAFNQRTNQRRISFYRMENWHAESADSVLKKLHTSPSGLSIEEAKKRLEKYGPNEFKTGAGRSFLSIFLGQFKNAFILILVGAGVISFFLGDNTDAIIIGAAVLVNIFLGFWQEAKAEKSFVSLKRALEESAYVIRDGKELLLKREEVVPGDIVVFRAGEKIPADARIIASKNFLADEAILTGEWLAVKKNTNMIPIGTNLLSRSNMAFAGTIITEGAGRGVVVATGSNTEIGKIAELVSEVEETKTPLEKELKTLTSYITLAIVFVMSSLFLLGVFWRHINALEMFLSSAALAVAAVPEGLAISVTIVMAIGMQKLFKKQALVRHLFAAQTLGSVSLIATDKTGTLTEANMQVSQLLTGTGELLHDGKKYLKPFPEEKENSHVTLLRVALMLSEAEIENPDAELEELKLHGNPTEKALVKAAFETGLRKENILKEFPRIDFVPFDSGRKYSYALHRDLNQNRNVVFMLGAPEIILSRSSSIQLDGSYGVLTENKRGEILRHFEGLTQKGLRVIAAGFRLSQKDSLDDSEHLLEDFVFVGLIALRDPLRSDAKEAVRIAHEAGIGTVLITGDHRFTAEAIAEEVGIITESHRTHIIDGKEFDKMSDADFQKRVSKIDVFARVTPEQKLRIVEGWQKHGDVLAMTRDGVNDAPALRRADIGVALGSGTDLAKEASDIVLINNSFSGIVTAIKEGRIIFENIRKIVVFLLSDAFAETILVSFSIIMGYPLPLLPAQILWINLVEDTLPNTALAFEEGNGEVMKEKPEFFRKLFDRRSFLLTLFFGLITISVIISFFLLFLSQGRDISYIRTMLFLFVGGDSLFYILSIRNFHKPFWKVSLKENPYMIPSIVIGFLMLLSAVYVPFLQSLLKTVPLNFSDWAIIVSYGLGSLLVAEVLKFFLFHRR